MKKRPGTVETVDIPGIQLRAQMKPPAAQAEGRVVEAVFYTGAEVVRMPMFDDPYLLSFSMDPKAVRLGRLNDGAPILNAHQDFLGVEAILGVVDSGRIENGEGLATLRFSNRSEIDTIWQDIQDGVLGKVSMGVQIYEITELGEDEATGMARVQATDWEPKEISLVGVPADPGAQIQLADESLGAPCRIIHRAEAAADAQKKGNTMKIQVRLLADTDEGLKGQTVEILESDFNEELHSRELAPKPAPVVDAEAMKSEVTEGLAADKAYRQQIDRIAAHYELDDLWAQRQVRTQATAQEALAAAVKEQAKKSPIGPNDISFGTDYEAQDWKLEAMADALAARATRQAPPESARSFANYGFGDCAVECLAFVGRGRNLHPRRDAGRIFSSTLALHTTSDFPLLLANTLNKILLPAYQNATPTYRELAAERQFNDFRPHNFLRSGDFPVPLEVNEHGEFKYGTIGENNEPVTAVTYGRIVGLSRQTLVNDDLGALGELGMKAAVRTADFENATFYSVCILAGSGLGPDLSDTNPVYDAAHSNVGTGGALDLTTIGEARALLMKQTALDGIKLNLPATLLLVSPDSLTLAEQYTAPASQLIGQGASASPVSNVNPFAGRLRPIGDANLTGTRFYVMTDPGVLANYVYGYLGGQGGPRTEVRNGFEIDGVEFKLAIDFGVGAIDSRGGVTNAGA